MVRFGHDGAASADRPHEVINASAAPDRTAQVLAVCHSLLQIEDG